MKNLWVFYPTPVSLLKDKKIRKTIEGFGGKWYGAGASYSTGERDNSFHIPDECEEIICAALKKMKLKYVVKKQ